MKEPSLPLHAVITKVLTGRIESGDYPVGGLLPTELELSAEMKVSRQTMREAIRRLSELGLVSRQPGVGTKVLRQSVESHYSHRMESLSELIDYAHDVPLTLREVELVHVNRDVARMLSCRVRTPWLWARGHRQRPDEPTLYTVSDVFVRPDYPGLEARLLHSPGPVYDLLEREYGEVIEEVRQEIFAVSLSPETAAALSAPAGTPAMEIHRRFIGVGDRLILYGRSISPGSRFSYLTTFRRDREPR